MAKSFRIDNQSQARAHRPSRFPAFVHELLFELAAVFFAKARRTVEQRAVNLQCLVMSWQQVILGGSCVPPTSPVRAYAPPLLGQLSTRVE